MNNTTLAVTTRIQKENTPWRRLRMELFNKQNIKTKIKIMLRNALVRPALTYSLQTTPLEERNVNTIAEFAFKRIRKIRDPEWYMGAQKPRKRELYKHYQKPTIQSWIQKQAITPLQTNNPFKPST